MKPQKEYPTVETKKVSLTKGQFLSLSEAQAKILVAEGYEIVIVDNELAQPKVENKPVVDKSTTKPANTTKSGKKNKPTAPKGAKKHADKSAKAIKKGDFFKVVVNDKVTAVGKANNVRANDKIVETVGGKKYALENCIAISKKQYQSLKKTLKPKSEPKASTSKRLNATDYKIVYCKYLKDLGKIDDSTFAKAKDSAEIRSELYKQFKDDVHLSNDKALEMFAASAKAEVAKA